MLGRSCLRVNDLVPSEYAPHRGRNRPVLNRDRDRDHLSTATQLRSYVNDHQQRLLINLSKHWCNSLMNSLPVKNDVQLFL